MSDPRAFLEELLSREAAVLAEAGAAHPAFQGVLRGRLQEQPITPWEAERWSRGLRLKLLQVDGHRFRLGSGRKGSFSFFVRNDENLMVGLFREAVTQAAAYVALVTDYGYPRASVRFELDYMDVALLDEGGGVRLYAESKASDAVLKRLAGKLANEFAEGLPPLPEDQGDKPPPDSWRKAQHILKNRPEHFWAVSPGLRRAFRVEYRGPGFSLLPVPDIPAGMSFQLSA